MHLGIPSLDLMYVRPKCVHTKWNSHQNHRSDHSPPLHPFPPKKTTRRGAIQCTPTRTVTTFKVAPHFSSSTTDAGAVGLMWFVLWWWDVYQHWEKCEDMVSWKFLTRRRCPSWVVGIWTHLIVFIMREDLQKVYLNTGGNLGVA